MNPSDQTAVLATLLIRALWRKDMRNSQGSSLHMSSTSRFIHWSFEAEGFPHNRYVGHFVE